MDSHDDRLQGTPQRIEEKIVIVGGGIGGLACALALHRAGLKAVVLEQSDTLRAQGTSLTLWTNALRVLDVLGIGEQFRSMYCNILEYVVYNQRGKRIAGLVLADCKGGPHEMRGVERKVLLEALAGQLPEGTIRFNSRATSIKKSESTTGVTEIQLQDGSIYSAKVVLGFDGQHSVVASWLGLETALPVGHVGIRGMAVFADGHKFEAKTHYTVGKGVRAAIVPVNATKAYWFTFWNEWSEGFPEIPQEKLKEEALERVQVFQSSDVALCVRNTPLGNFTKNSIRHRLNTAPPSSQVSGGVTVAGDASHPTTPNMGQGGCMALEDAILLTQKLYPVLTEDPAAERTQLGLPEHERIHNALVEFQQERHERTYAISVRSYKTGQVMQSGWWLVCLFRDWWLLPKSLNTETFLDHTLFDVGKLPGPAAAS